MRVALAFVMLLLAAGVVAEPVYIDQLMETPLQTLQKSVPGLKREGCYQLAPDRYVMISIDKKDGKPWRVALAAADACRRAEDAAVDVRHRNGVDLGDTTISVIEKLGRPDASAAPETKLKQL